MLVGMEDFKSFLGSAVQRLRRFGSAGKGVV